MERLVEKLGVARFYSVSSGSLALEAAREQHFNLIVIDSHTPGSDALLGQLRADPDLASIPVIALSSQASEADIQRGLAAGVDEYLTKPLDLDLLSKALIKLLS